MSIGEIVRIALIDTALGMGTVFFILIFISVCIWLLGISCREKPAAAVNASVGSKTAEPVEAEEPEIIAAVSAAIHQYIKDESIDDDQYTIRNVRRSTWKHTS